GYSDAKVAALVSEAIADGFTHLKIKVGADPEDDLRRVRMVRGLVGSDVLISIDANQRWDVGEAIANVGNLARSGLYWVEEPTSCTRTSPIPSGSSVATTWRRASRAAARRSCAAPVPTIAFRTDPFGPEPR